MEQPIKRCYTYEDIISWDADGIEIIDGKLCVSPWPLPVKERYTYADILSWDESIRAEIIDGKLYLSPRTLAVHQEVSGKLSVQIWDFLKNKADKKYQLFSRPLGVRLFEQDDDTPDKVDTLVEPDIAVCSKSKLDDYGCKGAPDFIIEILSPSNIRHDRLVKFNLYQRAKVKEYWITDPTHGSVEVFLLDESGRFTISDVYNRKDIVKVTVLPSCEIDLSKVFPN